MNELEALQRLRNGYDDKYYKQFTMSSIEQDKDYEIVRKALTPPTQQEVCDDLTDYITKQGFVEKGFKVVYDKSEREFSYSSKRFDDEEMWYKKITVAKLLRYLYVIQLPPHLITLIGRFYEAQSND